MFIDLDAVDSARFAANVCIVGSGPAGLSLASVLLNSGVSTILLESGGREVEAAAQELNFAVTEPIMFNGAVYGRTRAFGGTTNSWGGQLLPLEALDFEPRPWIAHSGWPLSLTDLTSYYSEALAFAGVNNADFDSDVERVIGVESPFRSNDLRYFFSKWTPHRRFGELLADELTNAEHVRVFLHATVTRLHLREPGLRRIEALTAVNSGGRASCFEADVVILCTGGIEAPRILLSNRQQIRAGIGNQQGLVGRYFHDHPAVVVGMVLDADSQLMRHCFGPSEVAGIQLTGRLSLPPTRQIESGLLNASAHVGFDFPWRLLTRNVAINLARSARGGTAEAMAAVDGAARLGIARLQSHLRARRLGPDELFTVVVISEQEPTADSAVTLAGSTDRYGVPRAQIAWRMTDKVWATVRAMAATLRDEFSHTGLGDLRLFPHVKRTPPYWRALPFDCYHHMGTTRMGETACTGVVDPDCRVFGVENLYVLSSSVFPTGGHSNCTLTIMALAYRLADHLSLR